MLVCNDKQIEEFYASQEWKDFSIEQNQIRVAADTANKLKDSSSVVSEHTIASNVDSHWASQHGFDGVILGPRTPGRTPGKARQRATFLAQLQAEAREAPCSDNIAAAGDFLEVQQGFLESIQRQIDAQQFQVGIYQNQNTNYLNIVKKEEAAKELKVERLVAAEFEAIDEERAEGVEKLAFRQQSTLGNHTPNVPSNICIIDRNEAFDPAIGDKENVNISGPVDNLNGHAWALDAAAAEPKTPMKQIKAEPVLKTPAKQPSSGPATRRFLRKRAPAGKY